MQINPSGDARQKQGSAGSSTVDRMIEYIDVLETEIRDLRRQLAEAKGDVPPDEVADTAQSISEWLKDNLPDPSERETYILAYMDSAYIKDARNRLGPGHAKAIAMAADMSMPRERRNGADDD